MDFYSRHTISERKASELLDTGEWKTDIEISKIIYDRRVELRSDWVDWAISGEKLLSRDCGTLDRPIETIFNAAREVSLKHLEDKVENHLLPSQNYNDGLIAFRVKPNAIYRLGATTQSSMLDIFSIVFALSTVSPYPVLLTAWVGLSIKDVYDKIISGYEEVTDPEEQIVFEAIHLLSSKLTVKNYTALEDKNFDEAYGYIHPTTEELICSVDKLLKEKDALRAIGNMKSRKIIEERNGRWRIVW